MEDVRMKKTKIFFPVAIFICVFSSMALANGLNLNSLGSRALAMGGAFVGLADDFSAIYWNPAGIVQFKRKYFGFYATDIIPSGTYERTEVPAFKADTESKQYLSGLAAYYYPVSENVVAGVGVYVPSGLGAKWSGADFAPLAGDASYLWESKIGLITFAPALAVKINDMISVGAALNINYGTFDIKMHAGLAPNPAPPPDSLDLGQYEESMTGWGYGATIGVLVKPMEKLSLGATFRTESTVKFKGEAQISNLSFLGIKDKTNLKREVSWPMWIAAGAAFTPEENLTLTADLQWTQWSKIDEIETNYIEIYWQIMMQQSGDDKMPMHWKNTLQIRFGAEYRINTFALRAGYYIDPSPSPDSTMNVLLPSYDFKVITAGFGYALDGLQLDFSLEYLMGKERSVGTDNEFNMPGKYNQKIIVPNISISYKF